MSSKKEWALKVWRSQDSCGATLLPKDVPFKDRSEILIYGFCHDAKNKTYNYKECKLTKQEYFEWFQNFEDKMIASLSIHAIIKELWQ